MELASMPKGVFCAEDVLDTGANGVPDIPVKVRVTISDDRIEFDFTGSGEAVLAPINCSIYGACSGARIAYQALVSPHTPANEGFYSPLEVIAPEGCFLNAQSPYPVSCDWEPIQILTDVIMKALAPVMPERIPAGHFLSIIGTIIGGTDDQSGKPFVLCEPQAGGWGAGRDKDGERGLVAICDGETFIIPVEICEFRYPVRVEQFTFNPKAGAGEFIGGHGLIRDYRILNSNAELTTIASRYKYSPWGLNGGEDGSINEVRLIRPYGGEESRATWSHEPLSRGDLVRFVSAGGGGYGDPHKRPSEKVLSDWKNQYISAEEARCSYGIVIDEAGAAVDDAETVKLRQSKSGKG